MGEFDKILAGLASFLWPCIFFFIIYYFRNEFKSIFTSIRELEVGGAKLSFGQAADQLNKELADLRNEFNAFKANVEQGKKKHTAPEMHLAMEGFGLTEKVSDIVVEPDPIEMKTAVKEPCLRGLRSILWVDDNPNNNAFIIKDLKESGIHTTTVTSTLDGIKAFCTNHYDLVISDMGRAEGNKVNFTAGIDLTQQIREMDKTIPIVIYCSSKARSTNASAALQAGANIVVSSPTKLMAFINQPTT